MDVFFTLLLVICTAFLALYTKKLWSATTSLVTGAADTAQKQLRAYVCVSSAKISFEIAGAPEVQVVLKNCGQTPAHDLRCWIHIWIEDYPLKVLLPVPPSDFPMAVSVLEPGGHLLSAIKKDPPVRPCALALLGTPQGTVYVYGQVTYKDVFSVERITRYRLIYGGNEPARRQHMMPDIEGNEAT